MELQKVVVLRWYLKRSFSMARSSKNFLTIFRLKHFLAQVVLCVKRFFDKSKARTLLSEPIYLETQITPNCQEHSTTMSIGLP